MSDTNATVPETARKWLAYQHRLSARDIDTAFSDLVHRNSNLGRLRQEALDVAEFVESLNK